MMDEDRGHYVDEVWDKFLDRSYVYLVDLFTWEDESYRDNMKDVEVLRELRDSNVANFEYEHDAVHMAWLVDGRLVLYTLSVSAAVDIRAVVLEGQSIQWFIDRHPAFFEGLFRHSYSV